MVASVRNTMQAMRERRMRAINELIAGRDLVATTLSTPGEIVNSTALRDAVLGRACVSQDDEAMVRRITKNKVRNRHKLIADAARPENGRFPALLDAWKLIVCDVRFLEEVDSLQDAYEAQLREEELQTPAERAREVVRMEDERMARRNARWFIPVLEHLSSDELAQISLQGDSVTKTIWKQVSPAPPAWIQQISDASLPWGFVFYKTRDLEQKYGHRWNEIWGLTLEQTNCIPYSSWDERSVSYACLDRIHCGSTIKGLWTEDWPAGPAAGYLAEDTAVREHFRGYRESLSSPGILRNTFIVVDAEELPESLEDIIRNNVDDFWVWAYDADWDPLPSTKDTVSDGGEEYEGRVKVSIHSLDAWFYAARYEGVSLRDMWLKAQRHPQKQWICLSKAMEEWDHESYV